MFIYIKMSHSKIILGATGKEDDYQLNQRCSKYVF